jgi:LmbE family N-acetylglucosaminyl deacetylase
MGRTLVVVAHPDDEVLGCGASMARWAQSGETIKVVALADGVSSRTVQHESIGDRRSAAVAALTKLGVDDLSLHDFPDQQLDTIPLLTLASEVSHEVKKFTPHTVITHSLTDLNLDHRLVAEATLVACRPEPGISVRRLMHCEVPSATGWRFGHDSFRPSMWVDVAETMSNKREALECYGPEIREWPHARSIPAIEALMRWRGASVGMEAAEAFEVSYWLDD